MPVNSKLFGTIEVRARAYCLKIFCPSSPRDLFCNKKSWQKYNDEKNHPTLFIFFSYIFQNYVAKNNK